MRIFIDEVGDNGLKFEKNSSNSFIVAMVIFRYEWQIHQYTKEIEKLKASLHFSSYFEFHFARNNKKIQQLFIDVLSAFDFTYYIFIIDKKHCEELGLLPKHSFYEHIARLICKHTKDILIKARITIDNCGGNELKNLLSVILKQGMNDNTKRVKKVRTENSRKEPLLQVADYIVGIEHRNYNEEKSAKIDYLPQIKNKRIKIVVRPMK
jgi:hypothetical protein